MPGPETAFTPLASLFGGALIGLAALGVLMLLGRIAGVSGIALAALSPGAPPGGRGWRLAFLAGLVAAPALHAAATGAWAEHALPAGPAVMALAGLLVGFGAALGSGCTSGHGVCGLGRLSRRSLVAVPVFMGVAIATTLVLRHALGPEGGA
jgi:hypothetical protein